MECPQSLAMEPDSSRQQIPDMLEREETVLTISNELQVQSPQRSPNTWIPWPCFFNPEKDSHLPLWEEDLQPEDRPCSPERKILKLEPHHSQNCDFIEKDQFQNINKDNNPNLNPIVNPEKVTNVKLTNFDLIQSVKDSFEEQTNVPDKTELFTEMKSHLNLDKESSIDIMPPGEPMRSLLAYYLDKHKGQEKQYAFATASLKNGDLIHFPAVYPDHPEKSKNSASVHTKKHSEEKLIRQINKFLRENGKKVIDLLVYSYNSPCLRREKNTPCCMFLLLEKAAQWHSDYGFSTTVAFTKCWGLTGPNFFKGLTYSDISGPGSVFFNFIEICKDIPFKLISNRGESDLRKKLIKKSENSTIYEPILQVEARSRNKLHGIITSTDDKLVAQAKSSRHKKDHLDRGKTIITSLHDDYDEFLPEVINEIVTTLMKNWTEVVNNESVSPIREKITTDFNTAVVQLYVEQLKCYLGDSSPLKLYQLSQNMEAGGYVQQIRDLLNLD